MRIAVTGANGFVGMSLVRELARRGHQVRALTRFPDAALSCEPVETIATGPIEAIEDWRPYLSGIESVIHLAARAHLNDREMQDDIRIRAINTAATLALAKSAAKRKVGHFIYISSIGAHGNETKAGLPFRADSPLNPQSIYARSKADAERGLRAMQALSAMRMTVLRPPLVYGPGARGNFRKLCRLVARAPALPFASVDNRRSWIAVENLTSAICAIAEKGAPDYGSYVICDGEDFSLPRLVSLIAEGSQKRCPLVPVPPFLLVQFAALLGRRNQMSKLVGSLQVDASDFRRDFSWASIIDAGSALKAAAASCQHKEANHA